MSKLVLFLATYLGLYSLVLSVLAHFTFRLWLVSISDEGSLPEITLSGASKLASTYFTLYYRIVHVIYNKIYAYPINIYVPHEVKINVHKPSGLPK